MEEMYGIPSDHTADTEDFSYYTHPLASLPPQESEYEVFGSPWLSTSSGTISVSAASATDAANTHNSLQKSGSSSLEEESSSAIRAKISSHHLYPKLLQTYIDCHKVGAPPETAGLLDKILQENDHTSDTTVSYGVGEDPELDEFMETYCEMLAKYKSDLGRHYDEASEFLNNIETQLSKLCNNATSVLVEGAGSSNDDTNNGEVEVQDCDERSEVREIKDQLLHKYGGCITSLRHEFSQKRKKGKLPPNARQILQNWWTVHYNWPYPTEADKVALAETTGLDQKQINNWFINQRKRHWKPSDNLKPFVMSNLHLHGSFFPE